MKYRTIVADPPWALEWNANIGTGRSGQKGLDYLTLTVEEICGLPVADMAEASAHLWLWTTATFLLGCAAGGPVVGLSPNVHALLD